MGLLYIILYIPYSKSLLSSIKTVKRNTFFGVQKGHGFFSNEKKHFTIGLLFRTKATIDATKTISS